METEKNEINAQYDPKKRMSFQVKVYEIMGGDNFEKWSDKYAGHFHDLLEEDPSLVDRVCAELDTNWDAPSTEESPLVREVADELQSRYDLGKEAESDDEESHLRAA